MYFEKTENKRMKYGYELVQIRYTKDLPQFDVKSGQLGGWISERAFLAQNGKWFLSENVEVFGGYIHGGEILGGEILGGYIDGGVIHGGEIRGGWIYGGWIYGGEIRGGVIRGGEIHGGEIRGGWIDGDLPKDFGQVPCLIGGLYPVNFAGYSKEGARKFACGCQIYEEIKWTPKFMKSLSKEYGFSESELEICVEMYSLLKKITPKNEN